MNAEVLTLSADDIAARFENDPELEPPQYPRVPPEILVLPFGKSGLLFEGAESTQVLGGKAARALLPRLLPLLDGTNTAEQVCEKLPGVSLAIVKQSVALLYSRGLLEHGSSPAPQAGLEDLDAFAGRLIDVTRANLNRGEALQRLASASAFIAGSGRASSVVFDALSTCGLRSLEILSDPSRCRGRDGLLIAVFEPGDDPTPWFRAAQADGMRVLHAFCSSEGIEVGPLFAPGKSACYECFRRIYPQPGGESAPDFGFWAGVVANVAFELLSSIGLPRVFNSCDYHRRTEVGPLHEDRRIARLPGCSTCGMTASPEEAKDVIDKLWVLHNSTTLPPLEFQNLRDHQHHYAASNIQITKSVPEPYYGSVLIELPPAGELGVPPSWILAQEPDRSPTLGDLSTILRYAVGERSDPEDLPRRIAPTGGGLASSEMFVIARKMAGLDDGIYHYYAPGHVLERLQESPDELLAGALGIAVSDLPRLVLVGTATLAKLRQKYGLFSYRFANLDAGIANLYVREVASALRVRCTEYASMRDKALAHAIGLPTAGNRNFVTYALGIGAPHRPVSERFEITQCIEGFMDCVSRTGEPQRPFAWSSHPSLNVFNESLGAIMRVRRSVRKFAESPVPSDVLRALVKVGMEATRGREATGGLSLRHTIWLAVTRNDGDLERGVYKYDGSGDFKLVRGEVSRDALRAAMLQASLSSAPAIVFVTADFPASIQAHGGIGYRELLGRAGTIVGRMLLAAYGAGICGCPWGGFMEDAWGPLLHIDRFTDCPVFGLSLGYPQL